MASQTSRRNGKVMTVRLDDERAAILEMVARADDQTLNGAMRAAIDSHIAERRKDVAFRDRLRSRHAEDCALYERLAGD